MTVVTQLANKTGGPRAAPSPAWSVWQILNKIAANAGRVLCSMGIKDAGDKAERFALVDADEPSARQ